MDKVSRAELSQLYWLNKEKKMWQRELDRIKNQSLIAGQDYRERYSHSNAASGKQERDTVNKDEVKAMIAQLQEKIDAEEKRMMQYILTIDDSLIRQIVHYRCVCLMPWVVVAREIGGGNTADSVRKQFERYFTEK